MLEKAPWYSVKSGFPKMPQEIVGEAVSLSGGSRNLQHMQMANRKVFCSLLLENHPDPIATSLSVQNLLHLDVRMS